MNATTKRAFVVALGGMLLAGLSLVGTADAVADVGLVKAGRRWQTETPPGQLHDEPENEV